MMLTTFRMPDITMTQPTLQLACHTCTTWYTYQMFPPPVWQAQLSTCKRRPEANNTELSGTTGTRTWCIFYNKLLITSLTFTCAMVASNRYNCHWRLYILTGQTSWPPSEFCIQRLTTQGTQCLLICILTNSELSPHVHSIQQSRNLTRTLPGHLPSTQVLQHFSKLAPTPQASLADKCFVPVSHRASQGVSAAWSFVVSWLGIVTAPPCYLKGSMGNV